jgi:D-glycero-D-manno-heptose 1,7-bisphosphate phosphatase
MEFSNLEYVFLDRDGVLNRKPPVGEFVTRWEEFHLLPGVEDALARLNRSGRIVIVVTNQRGVALGLYSLDDVERMHRTMQAQLAVHGAHIDAIYICPHDNGQCTCRKPLTGLFEQAFQDFRRANAQNSVMIGDSLRDIQAGHALGMRTVLVEEADAPAHDLRETRSLADISVRSLSEFIDILQAQL